ncbi:MAG: mechanosensitive ion channel protein [Thermodesulfobacteriota bacterium]|nr:MAG: mechanosensitive ion channel protein [Thermodesulfobacteriota bacterium]
MKERLDAINEVLFNLLKRLLPNVEANSLLSILITAVVATILAALIFIIIRGLTGFIEKKVLSLHFQKIRTLRFQNQEILTGSQIAWGISRLFRWFRYFAYLVIIYLYINTIFSFFPKTRGVSAKLFDYFIDAISFVLGAAWGYLPNLVTLIVIFAFGYYLIKLTRLFFKGVEEGRISLSGFYPEWASPTYAISRFLIIAFLIIVAFPYLPGKDSPAFQAVSIFFGVLISLGSTGAVSNVVAGIVLTYMRAFKIGDTVQIADTNGDIVEKTMFVTRIRTVKNVEITVPNAMVLNDHIINYSALAENEGLVLHSKVTIGYDVPWKEVHDLLKEAAKATEGLEKEPEPFVLQTALNDFYVEYEINAYTKLPRIMSRTYNELHRNIQDKFNEAGVEIASPSITMYRDGNQSNIPDDYLPKDHKPPQTGLWPLIQTPKKPEK